MGNSESNSLTDFDSTWEDEDYYEDRTKSSVQWPWSAQRNTDAAKDMQNYRYMWRITRCDDVTDHELDDQINTGSNINEWNETRNIKEWDFSTIADGNSSYMANPRLFPTHEKGRNASHELSPEAIKLFRRDEQVKKRLLTSYKLMLDFYGIELISEETGEVRRATNWTERSANLNRNTHNNLRITRILKSMGLLGFSHYQAPLVHFFLVETLVQGTLPQVKQSALDYFMFAVVDKTKRKELIKFALCYFEPKEKFVWCPKSIQNQFLKELECAHEEWLGNAK
ncbi:opioid growth factor receptor-like isoform X2 [Tachysurus fulvidraco]|uniref:opioid growth factor receptor-like isoform X2 n=1 Tax=Tachysurus fulvidraco TaxID=1234273 RepID=UPI001FEEE5ED|nr:opioid growth factor receptor-like isoform X2 [Tachysurus fulvidraco]